MICHRTDWPDPRRFRPLGVSTFTFENESFFGQDRIDLLIWRMESKGLSRRG